MISAENLPIPTQLLPCLAIPFVELFPDLCLGWFTPPSLNLKQYKKMGYLRISLQFIAWFPVYEMLFQITPTEDGGKFSTLVIGTAACVALRNYLMQKQVERVLSQPLWGTDLPRAKREALFVVISNSRPTDVNKFDDMTLRYVTFPTKIAVAVMYGLVNYLHEHLGEQDRMKLMGALAAFAIGGIGIGGTRHGNLTLDCLFRCVFGAGFIAILHFVAEVSDIVLMKSVS
ncbi:hypothetical protein ACHAWF_018460 [Thalassiosira exigua]